jgi:hypothetical protein
MSMSISLAQARVVDPVLSNVARGFVQQPLAAAALFPRVPVMAAGGQIINFGREDFRNYNIRRAPGTATKRIPVGYAGAPYALFQDALEIPVPREHMRDASVVPGINLGTIATRRGINIARLSWEVEAAALARNTASYPSTNRVALGSGARWSDANVNPSTSIEAGRSAIRTAIGVYPNTAVLSARAFDAARNNVAVLERFKYTSSESVTEEMLARLWNLDTVMVGQSITVDQADVGTDVWGTDVILAYTAVGSLDNAEPSFGYTYHMEGHPLVEQAYWDNREKSWIYPVTFERVPVVAGGGAGYLIQTAAA